MSTNNLDFFYQDINDYTVKYMKDFLKSVGSYHSFKNKQEYLDRIEKYDEVVHFSWREDQQKVIDAFIEYTHKVYVVHAVFGSGKTTLLMGMLIYGLICGLYKPEEVLFCSFNISIKNEIKRKLKDFGIGNKVTVRTFDSVVYEICKSTGYKYIDLPNFEGKRKHAFALCFNDDMDYRPEFQPKIIFVDECQDLEKPTLQILETFYPNSKFVFAGDIFQSIQKEPRESILWYFMTENERKDVFKIYMQETPRVPKKILKTLQKALTTYYPEFEEKINSWTSSNTISKADIEWKRLYSYSHIFDELEKFCDKYDPNEAMILTFSSAITVRGAMGDVARIRRFLGSKGYDINLNHKKNEPDSFFLSTANSSKGLERDYVICFLTFPLELAFVNLSDDVVVNIITVALTRAKKKVIMYVPSYKDKFSRVLNIFPDCPKPNRESIRKDKILKDFNISDYLNIEHSVTEIIKQGVLKYDTRIKIKENKKLIKYSKIFQGDDQSFKNVPKMITEEEKSYVGILIENLITSTWTGYWPSITELEQMSDNPMYSHISGRIGMCIKKYKENIKKTPLTDENQFDGILTYSQIHVALSDKIFIDLSTNTMNVLRNYWKALKPVCNTLKPVGGEVKIQSRVKMPWLTGVADAIIINKIKENKTEATIIEIKASIDREWKDDAMIQALLYSLMTGKTWSKIILLNPFKNEKCEYHFNSKAIITLRNLVLQDILIWNTNCMLAKLNKSEERKVEEGDEIKSEETLFLNIIKEDRIKQISLVGMLSPIKTELIYNSYSSIDKKEEDEEEEEDEKKKIDKFSKEAKQSEKDIINDIKDIIFGNVYKKKKIFCNLSEGDINKIFGEDHKIFSLNQEFGLDLDEMIEKINYQKKEDKAYSLKFKDGLEQVIGIITYIFLHKKFI